MTLKELLAANPDANAEHGQLIIAAEAKGEAAGKEKMNKAFAAALPILSSAKYPDTVKNHVTTLAKAGDATGLAGFVAIHDMNVESAASEEVASEINVETLASQQSAAEKTESDFQSRLSGDGRAQ